MPVCRGPEARLRHFLCSYPWAVRGARARGYEGVIPGIVCYFSPKRTATFFRAFANTGSVLAWACAFIGSLVQNVLWCFLGLEPIPNAPGVITVCTCSHGLLPWAIGRYERRPRRRKCGQNGHILPPSRDRRRSQNILYRRRN